MSEEFTLPQELVEMSNQSVEKLKGLKQEIVDKEREIKEQGEELDLRLKKLTANDKVKINAQEKAAFENDCKNYLKALEGVIQTIDTRIEGWEKFMGSEKTKKMDMLHVAISIHHTSQATKKFIKKTRKDLEVIHSRFSYRFEIQQKHLASLEHLVR